MPNTVQKFLDNQLEPLTAMIITIMKQLALLLCNKIMENRLFNFRQFSGSIKAFCVEFHFKCPLKLILFSSKR